MGMGTLLYPLASGSSLLFIDIFCESNEWGLFLGHLPGLCYSSDLISRTGKNPLTLFTSRLVMLCLTAFKPKFLSLSFIGNITTQRSSVVNLTSSSCVRFAPGQQSSEETLLLKKYFMRVDFLLRPVILPVYKMNSFNLFFIFRPQNAYS